MKHDIIGIVGGLGPDTSARFFLNLNHKFRTKTNRQPHLLLENLPITKLAEEKLILGGASDEHLLLIQESVRRLTNAGATLIVIPCNTVHIFIDNLRQITTVPILSIIESTVAQCQIEKNVGLLASTKTINEKLYTQALQNEEINIILPTEEEQATVNQSILRFLNSDATNQDKKELAYIIRNLQHRGAQCVILGCTDLPLLLENVSLSVKTVNSLEALEEATLQFLNND